MKLGNPILPLPANPDMNTEGLAARKETEARGELRTRLVSVRPLVLAFFQESPNSEWLARFAAECGVSAVTLMDPHAWISESFYYGILERIQAVVPNPTEAVRSAAHKGFTQQSLGTFYTVARAFGTPRMAYQYYPHYLNRIQAIGRYEAVHVGPASATLRYARQRITRCESVDCAYRLGALEALPTVFGLPLARVEHLACVCHGDADCLYRISWTPSLHKFRWGTLLAVLVTGGAIATFLPKIGVPASLEVYAVVGSLLSLGCWLVNLKKTWQHRLEEANELVAEQRASIQRELGNLWEKHEEALQRAREEERIRRIFQKYVPPTIVENVLKQEGQIRLRGTSVHATILFSDIVGFTAYAETADPAEVLKAINTYLGKFSEVVSAHDGVVDKFIGDAVMALFGAIDPDPQHLRQAIRTAMDMMDSLAELNQRTGCAFQLRIGIHTGPMVAGHVGSQERVAFTVMGDTVNLAQRIEIEAAPGTILVSEAVRDACANEFTFEFQQDCIVRGRKSATRMFRLIRN